MFVTSCGDKQVCVGLHWKTLLANRTIEGCLSELNNAYYWYRQESIFYGYEMPEPGIRNGDVIGEKVLRYSANIAFQKMLGQEDGLGIFQLGDLTHYVCVACIQGRPVDGFDRLIESETEIEEVLSAFHARSLGYRLYSNVNLKKAHHVEFERLADYIDESCRLQFHRVGWWAKKRVVVSAVVTLTCLVGLGVWKGGLFLRSDELASNSRLQSAAAQKEKARFQYQQYLTTRNTRQVMTHQLWVALDATVSQLPLEVSGFGFMSADCHPTDGGITCFARYRHNAQSRGTYRGFKSRFQHTGWTIQAYDRELKQVDVSKLVSERDLHVPKTASTGLPVFEQVLGAAVRSDVMWDDFGSQLQSVGASIRTQISEFKTESLPPEINTQLVEHAPYRFAEMHTFFPARMLASVETWPAYVEIKKMAWRRQGEPVFESSQSFLNIELFAHIYIK